jgi:hypothetical protein
MKPGNLLVIAGVMIVVFGLLINVFGQRGFPRLPGDILIQKENFTFYFPVVTSIVISILLTVLLNVFR